MKKLLAYVLTLAMTASVLVGCTGTTVVIENPTENVETKENVEVAEGAVKTGLSVMAGLSGESATAEAAGVATTDISLVAVTVDDNGVITGLF